MITPENVAVELGRATPTAESIEHRQWSSWITRAYAAIRRRAEFVGVAYESLDAETLDEVATYIVARRASRPIDGASQVSERVSVDDGAVQTDRRFPNAYGDLYVLDEWWAMLGLSAPSAGWAGSIPCRGW